MSVTSIEWTKRPGTIGETWNPTTGCNKVDRGCKNCYAEIMHKRLRAMGQMKYAQEFLKGAVPHNDTLGIPLAWKKPRTVFVNSMSDLFHKDVPFEFIFRVFQVMEKTPQHTYLILTKRPEQAIEFFYWMNLPEVTMNGWKFPRNVWMGTSANDQKSADERIPLLLKLNCSVLFLSYEPATGGVDLDPYLHFDDKDGRLGRLDWVICGGESGPKAVPMDPGWPLRVSYQCKLAGVPFFFKQWGLWHPITLPTDGSYTGTHEKGKDKGYNVLDGKTYQQFPEVA